MMTVYVLKYSAGLGRYWVTISIHRTKEGAEKCLILQKNNYSSIKYAEDQHPKWEIEEVKIQD